MSTVHFNNYICPYGYFICTAQAENRCLPLACLDIAKWKLQAEKRANNCHYRGAELTQNEIIDREINTKKADKIPYLKR